MEKVIKFLLALLPLALLADLPPNNSFAKYLNENAPTSEAFRLLSPLIGQEQQTAFSAANPARNAFGAFVTANALFSVSNLFVGRFSGVHFNHIFKEATVPVAALLAANEEIVCARKPKSEKEKDFFPYGRIEHVARYEPNDPWGSIFADIASQEAKEGNPAVSFYTEGVFLGYDYWNCPGRALFGGSLGYVRSDYFDHHDMGKGDINLLVLAPYATVRVGDFYAEFSAVASFNWQKSERNIVFPGFDETAAASYNSYQLMPHIGFGYDFIDRWDGSVFEPFASFDFVVNWQEGFSEHGSGAFNMREQGNTSYMLRSEIGFNVYQVFDWLWGMMVLRETGAYVNKAFFGLGKVTSALVGFPGSFTMESFTDNQNLGTWGVSGMIRGLRGFYGVLSYDGEAGSGYLSNEIQFKLGKFF